MKYFLALSLCCLGCVASEAAISEFEFKAPLTDSRWKLEENNQLICRLTHEIPQYGKIEFSSKAAKNRGLVFKMRPLMETKNTVPVTVRAIAPDYRPGIPDEDLSMMKSYKYFAGELRDQDAWTLTFALSQGKNIGFFFNDWYYKNKPVQVTVNSINFRKNFSAFQGCLQNLLPYSFEDVSMTVVNFIEWTSELTEDSKERLDRLITYLSVDRDVTEIIIDSFSDSFGTPDRNRKLSSERAAAIGKYIEHSGIPATKLTQNAYGEKEHIAPNSTEEGRAHNRRVVVTVKNTRLHDLKHDFKAEEDLGKLDITHVNDLSQGSEDEINSENLGEEEKSKGEKHLVSPADQQQVKLSQKDMNTETAKDSRLPNLAKDEDE